MPWGFVLLQTCITVGRRSPSSSRSPSPVPTAGGWGTQKHLYRNTSLQSTQRPPQKWWVPAMATAAPTTPPTATATPSQPRPQPRPLPQPRPHSRAHNPTHCHSHALTAAPLWGCPCMDGAVKCIRTHGTFHKGFVVLCRNVQHAVFSLHGSVGIFLPIFFS